MLLSELTVGAVPNPQSLQHENLSGQIVFIALIA